jgi:hypothetical protein
MIPTVVMTLRTRLILWFAGTLTPKRWRGMLEELRLPRRGTGD